MSLFLLLALFAPTQLPSGAQKGWRRLLLRVNPLTAGEHYVGKVVVDDQAWSQNASWLVAPVVGAVLLAALSAVVGGRFLRLRGGVAG